MFWDEEFAIDSDWIASCCWVCRAESLLDLTPESIESEKFPMAD